MTVSDANASKSHAKILVWALVISLLVHFGGFLAWKTGQKQGWWKQFAVPRWLESMMKPPIRPTPELKKLAVVQPPETVLNFVQVDPALAMNTPPPKPMFVGAKNTEASNPDPKQDSLLPQIDGKQKDYLQTAKHGLNESPKHTAEATPPPTTPAQPAPNVQENTPKKSVAAGNTSSEKPDDKERKGVAKIDQPDQPAHPQNTSDQTQPQPIRPRRRPSTVAEAKAASGMTGDQSKHEGGVNRVAPDIGLDVKGTPMGDYLNRMVDAVQTCWYDLLKDQVADVTGRVVLHFRLLPDGSIKNMDLVKSEVTTSLELACERAILKPAPYEKWPPEMKADIGDDHYDITFTFYYEP